MKSTKLKKSDVDVVPVIVRDVCAKPEKLKPHPFAMEKTEGTSVEEQVRKICRHEGDLNPDDLI